MNAKQMLKLIGYWKGDRDAQRFPDPRRLVDAAWERGVRAALVGYLKSGITAVQYRGLSYCRFDCGVDEREMGSRDLTDGVWVWPEGLAHYIEKHDVVLPLEFVAFARSKNFGITATPDEVAKICEKHGRTYDFTTWDTWSK